MSKIEFEQVSENEVEVVIPPETPMAIVQQLTKSFIAKGLTEDLSKSTLSVRYFVRQEDSVNAAADKLIKSLQGLTKDEELPYWHPKAQMANQKRVREMEIAERRAKNGVKQPTNVSPAPEPHVMPDAAPKAPTTPSTSAPMTPAAYTAPHPKMVDTNAANMRTADGTGKRYGFIKGEDEHVEGCRCNECLEMQKSGYKGYNLADNIRRKANNTGDQTGFGTNVNTKQYTSAKFSNQTPQTDPKLKKPQAVKQWTPEQIAAENEKRGLKKSWGQHLPFPSAEQEIMRLAKETAQVGETAMANQLASMMRSKSMLSNHQQPSSQDFEAAGEAMGLGVSEEMAKGAERQWNGAINNWLIEASKPISQRFSSEEEEVAYWSNIKVEDRDDGKSGY